MFKKKPLILPSQLEWKYKDEKPIAEWSLKARPYNTTIANGMFIGFLLLFSFMSARYGSETGSTLSYRVLFGSMLFLVSIGATLSMTHQKTNFAYRLTESALEYCEWKDFPEWILTFLKWFAGITFVGMLAFSVVAPAAVIGAILGPGLIGLVYLGMINSSSFREMHTKYNHQIQEWSEFKKITVFRRRHIVGLDFTWYNPHADEGVDKMINSTRKIYCQKEGFDRTVQIIKAQLPPSTPYTEGYIPIYA